MLEPASTELINKELEFFRSEYSFKTNPGNLWIMKKMDDLGSIVDWFCIFEWNRFYSFNKLKISFRELHKILSTNYKKS